MKHCNVLKDFVCNVINVVDCTYQQRLCSFVYVDFSVALPKLETTLSSLREQVKQVDKMPTFPQG